MPSSLLTELASAAAEAEAVIVENFTWKSRTYVGVLGPAPIDMKLAVTGYAADVKR